MNIEQEADNKMKWWFWLANFWRAIDYFFVMVSFIVSIIVMCSEVFCKENDIIVVIGSILAATFTLMGYSIEPKNI